MGKFGRSRTALLQAGHAFVTEVPEALVGMVVGEHKLGFRVPATPSGSRSSASRSSLLPQSDNAYKVKDIELTRIEQLARDVNALLNKVCPENVRTITERVANTRVMSVEELQLVISLIFKKSLAEPHYCETMPTWLPVSSIACLSSRPPTVASQLPSRRHS